MTDPSIHDHFWWLASRASGITALTLITISVMLGLSASGKVVRPRAKIGTVKVGQLWKLIGVSPKSVVSIHELLSLASLIAIAVHGLTLLGDTYLHPSLANIAVPFTIGYRPVFTSLGIIGGYVAAALGLSFYLRKWIGGKTWRKLHRFTIVAYALSVIHTIGAGTDGQSAWLLKPVLGSAVVIAGLLAYRMSSSHKKVASPSAVTLSTRTAST